MSIASEITRLQSAKADLKSAIEAKGVTVSSSATLDDYDTYVAAISGGGGGKYAEGTYTLASAASSFSVSVNFEPKYAYAIATNWRSLPDTTWRITLLGGALSATSGSYQRVRLTSRLNNGAYGSSGGYIDDATAEYSNGTLTFKRGNGTMSIPEGATMAWFAAGEAT